MSVAFRRESDEEHLEPKFELPIPVGPNVVTPAGPALLAAEVTAIEIALAAAADEETRVPLARRLRYWRTRAATAEVVTAPTDGTIGIGSRVTIRLNGALRTLAIVGHDEANAADRIAYAAPLARALIGAEPGERVDFQNRPEAIEILAVEND
jgi:transcription elongation GreA/GreB family factor